MPVRHVPPSPELIRHKLERGEDGEVRCCFCLSREKYLGNDYCWVPTELSYAVMEELKRMGIRYSRTRRNRITVRLPGIGFREVKARIDVKTTIAELLVETERMIREKNLSPKSRENLLYNLNLLRVQTMKNVENEEVSNVK